MLWRQSSKEGNPLDAGDIKWKREGPLAGRETIEEKKRGGLQNLAPSRLEKQDRDSYYLVFTQNDTLTHMHVHTCASTYTHTFFFLKVITPLVITLFYLGF